MNTANFERCNFLCVPHRYKVYIDFNEGDSGLEKIALHWPAIVFFPCYNLVRRMPSIISIFTLKILL